MEILIIESNKVDQLKSIIFPKGNTLNPQTGYLNSNLVYWLQASLKTATYDNNGSIELLFPNSLTDFDSCQTVNATLETKYFYNDVEVLPVIVDNVTKYFDGEGNELNIFQLTPKTILNV